MVNHGNVVRRNEDGTIEYEDITIDHYPSGEPFIKGTFEKLWTDSDGNTHWPDGTISWEDSNGNTHYR